MKFIDKSLFLLVMAFAITGILSSCSEDDQPAKPMIKYVRVTAPASSDSLLAGAFQGSFVAIVGENLQGAKQVWFNDLRASLNSNFITNTSILTTVPTEFPKKIDNKMKIVFAPGDTIFYDFAIKIEAPKLASLSHEYGKPGQEVVVRGSNFFEPMTITFTGGVEAKIISLEETKIIMEIPVGAEPGPITFATDFGTTESIFHYRDQRNIILNYDNLTAAGSWRPGPIGNVNGLDGNYLRLFGSLIANQRMEDDYTSQFWGNKRFPEKRNLFSGPVETHALKFEARVKDWYGSVLQICWAPYENAGNGEYWGNLNGRGIWKVWEEKNAPFNTGDEWITVTIPLTEMKYSLGQVSGNNTWTANRPFDPTIAGTLTFWVIGTPLADKTPFEIHIDNVRIVPIL